MNFKRICMWWFVLILALSGCAKVTQDQAMKTVSSKYPNALFFYVDVLPPEKIKELTDKSWGFSQPVVVPPRTKSTQEGEAK